jgi:hypothetical protein
MNFISQPLPVPDTSIYSTEHILEFQMLPKFLDYMETRPGTWLNPLDQTDTRTMGFCNYYYVSSQSYEYWIIYLHNSQLWFQNARPTFPIGSTPADISGATLTPHDALMLQYPSKTAFTADWMLLINTVNGMKERVRSPNLSYVSVPFTNRNFFRCGVVKN